MFEINNCNDEMNSTISAFTQDVKNIRTGRVSPDVLKNLNVDSYGSKMTLPQLSNINNLDNITLHKMVFIYNAIIDGWTVKLVDNKFEFKKNKNNLEKSSDLINKIFN